MCEIPFERIKNEIKNNTSFFTIIEETDNFIKAVDNQKEEMIVEHSKKHSEILKKELKVSDAFFIRYRGYLNEIDVYINMNENFLKVKCNFENMCSSKINIKVCCYQTNEDGRSTTSLNCSEAKKIYKAIIEYIKEIPEYRLYFVTSEVNVSYNTK